MRNITKNDLKKSVSVVLLNLRKKRGWSQQITADFLQVSKMYISALETGKKTPNLLMFFKLSEVLGVDVVDFMKLLKEELDMLEKEGLENHNMTM